MGGFEKISGKAGGAGLLAVKDQFLELAQVARGAGVNIGDMGDVVATLVNRGIDAKDMVKTIESLVQQGKDGAVEFKDLATMLDASSGALGRFKMNEGSRITTAGGLSQMARTFGKKSAEESTNAVEDLARDLGGKADIIQALTGGTAAGTKTIGGKKQTVLKGGVQVGTDDTRAQLRDINTLLPEIIAGAFKSGNAGKIMGEGGMFTGNSTAIIAPLVQAFSQGIVKDSTSGRYNLAKDGEKASLTGEAAVKAMLTQFQAADVKEGSSKAAFDNVMGTSQAQFAVAMEKLKNDLGDKLAPAIAELTPKAIQLATSFGDLVTWAAESPKKAAAALVALTTAAGVAEAGLSVIAGKLGGALLDKLLPKMVPVMNVQAGTVTMTGGNGLLGTAAAGGKTG